jgi:hypothetical protein
MRYLLIFFSILLYTINAGAQDRLLSYTYQSNVLDKGAFDLEFQTTLKSGKSGAFSPYVYGRHLDQRLEFEFGLGSNIQTAFYINSEFFNWADTSSADLNQDHKISFSNEWKWKLSDPDKNAIGSCLYAEIEVGGNNVELEGKLILDKQTPKDLIAFNIAGVYEIEKMISRTDNITQAVWEHNASVGLYLGYLHSISPNVWLGIEAKNNNTILEENGWINSVFFAGPAFHASFGECFINVSAMPQIVNLHKTRMAPGNRDLNDFEAFEIRLHIGYDFD